MANDPRVGFLFVEFLLAGFFVTEAGLLFWPGRGYWIFGAWLVVAFIILCQPVLRAIAYLVFTLVWPLAVFAFFGGPKGIHDGSSIFAAVLTFGFVALVHWPAKDIKERVSRPASLDRESCEYRPNR